MERATSATSNDSLVLPRSRGISGDGSVLGRVLGRWEAVIGAESGRILLAVFIVSACLLALEVLFVRLVSILLYAVSTYLVISLALLGFGLTGTTLALRRSGQPISGRQAGKACVLFGVTTLLALVDIWFAGQSPVAALALPFALGIPFACGGLAIALSLSMRGIAVSKVYFADLLGAGVGTLIVLLGIGPLGGIRLGGIIAGLSFVAAGVFFGASSGLRRALPGVGLAVILLSALTSLPNGIVPIAPKELRRLEELGPNVSWEYQGPSPLARIDVLSVAGDRVELPQPFDYKLVMQDGGAPSVLLHMPDAATTGFIDHTVFGIPYWIKQQPDVLIIGLGGGPDVQAALRAGARSVTGVEINPKMIEIVRGPYADFTGRPYEDGRVRVIEGDGRHFVRLSHESYDIIQLTGVDTSVASLGGNPNLAENYLYTLEAFREFYQHLTPNGTLSISFPDVDGLGLRLVATAATALRAEGVADARPQMIASVAGGAVHILVKHAPFTGEEVRVIAARFSSPVLGLYFPLSYRLFGEPSPEFFSAQGIRYAPGLHIPGPYAAFLDAFQAGAGAAFLAAQPQTVFPSTDNWPFFFVLDKWGQQAPNLETLQLTFALLFAAACIFVLAPLFILRRGGLNLIAAPTLVLYFGALGFGFIFVEVVFIQNLALFLGHPSYALAVTLCTLLIASGLGSLFSGRGRGAADGSHEWSDVELARRTARVAAGVTILIFLAAVSIGPLFDSLLAWPLSARVVIAAALVAVPGFLMGMLFPSGLALVKRRATAFVPWAWAINSVATVMGTIAAVMVAMLFGFHVVFLAAAGFYALAALSGSTFGRS